MEAIINKLYQQESLTEQESQQLFDTIIRGELDPILMASALRCLLMRNLFRVLITILPTLWARVVMANLASTSR